MCNCSYHIRISVKLREPHQVHMFTFSVWMWTAASWSCNHYSCSYRNYPRVAGHWVSMWCDF